MSNFSATIPNARVAAVNAALAALGFGPNNFSVPVRQNPNAPATHTGLHCWDEALREAIVELNEPGLRMKVGTGEVNFNEHLAANGMARVPETLA